ncbi:mitochondrial carrier protein, putative [Plasmodium gallinaceum]|uniref:Mitochondrial carrier protein, putative n=1 Tax=Plasmodium gallinaceum TaxID=5849 RepID=A0A1J1GLY8_PLAGA|nr:mitochondrial carrier protein, putative [Plasmodium gallinaceum]CRG93339.1 mitochondrial carrier protein, putative [Plasmodium gallinaceum]
MKDNEDNILQTFLGSTFASTISRTLLYPLDTVKTNKQVHINNYKTDQNFNKNFFFSFIKKFGYKGLYKGFFFSSLTTIPATSLYFCSFEYLKLKRTNFKKKYTEKYGDENTDYLNFFDYFSLGLLAEAISCIIFVPIDVVKERMQAQKYLELKEYNKSYYLIKDLINKEGLFRLYRGYSSTCLTYGLFGGSFFFFQNIGNKLMKKLNIESSNFNIFQLNLICSFLSGLITSPLDIVRIRFQIQEKNKTLFYYNNSFDGINKLLKEGNIFNLFKGNLYRCSLVCLSMSINVTIIEMFKKIINSNTNKI